VRQGQRFKVHLDNEIFKILNIQNDENNILVLKLTFKDILKLLFLFPANTGS